MNEPFSVIKAAALTCAVLAVAACAAYSGGDLRPGVSTAAEVLASMGTPAMRWREADASEQLAYPRGPEGTQTFMVFIDPNGRLQRIEKVLDMAHFARIRSGESGLNAVLKLLGPPRAANTAYFGARDELVWEWKFCNSWNEQSFFSVLFDATTGTVRTTQQRPVLIGPEGLSPSCGH